MQVQVNTNHIQGSAELQEWVGAAVTERLERFDDLLTRVEIHVGDENAQKAGADDKRCQIEARPKGHQSLSVTHKAESLQLAVDGAAEKMRNALDHLVGKLDAKSVPTGHLDDPLLSEDPPQVTDALLQEEFLARQEALGKE
ncbi:HPF/RaiA family ribosome-associated protein [Stutzerimonas azotifigens]|uniref:HPF/RaiA family ribosome-associated protein n=1 Tax=Stutzerimonas azotifigens TaxID=291995 RepID=A0ABR5Z0V7_9GAMM|nr:HPF/RaiA family ribosome-associated protein [Stutzerimonas azotifigens]MBA1273826.1 HPF/RaiA family ribosome-associated protein [Stutzerimonas azotifigens]